MAKSLIAAIADGVRPISIKAVLQSWGPISLQDHAFWREWSGTGSFIGKQVTVDQALQLATVYVGPALGAG